MKRLNLLKTLIDLAFFFGVFAIVAMTIYIPFAWSDPSAMKLSLNGERLPVVEWPEKLLLLFAFVSAVLFIYSIFLLRKVIRHFVVGNLFNDDVVRYFNVIGSCLIASSLLNSIPMYVYDSLRSEIAELAVSGGGFDSFLLSVSLGLFFKVLAEVFKKAKDLKEENELTV